jgi:hypothetical protein
MPPRLHAVVQHAYDLDNARVDHAIEDRMYRVCHRRLAAFVTAVANTEAADAGNQLGTIDGQPSLGIGRDAAHRGTKARAITDAGVLAVELLAPPQDGGDLGLRRLGKPILRHAGSTARRCGKVVEIGVEVLVLDFGVVAAVERRDALLDREA